MTTTLDLRTKGPIADVRMQDHVRAVLQHHPIAVAVVPAPTIVAWVCEVVPPGTALAQAHAAWLEPYVGQVLTPEGLPRQPSGALTPAALVRVEIELIQRRSGGMSSHFGFEGYFLSLLVFLDRVAIWDARGEPAS